MKVIFDFDHRMKYRSPSAKIINLQVMAMLCQSGTHQRGSLMPGARGIWVDEEEEDF